MAVELGRRRAPLLIGTLMVAATVVFVWGAFAERSGHSETHAEKTTRTTPETTTESADPHARESGSESTTSTAAQGDSPAERAGESDSGSSTTVAAVAESPAQHAAESGSASGEAGDAEYHPLGVNLESTPLVVAAALFSLVLAAAVAMRPRREVLALIGVVAAAFAALEVVEVAHQASQSRPGLVALAAAALVLHAAVVLLAAVEGSAHGSIDS